MQSITLDLQVLEPLWTNFLLNCPPHRSGVLDPSIVTPLGQVGAAWIPNASRPPLPDSGSPGRAPVHPCFRDGHQTWAADARMKVAPFGPFASADFALVLLDIELAGSRYDGIQICRILRGRPAGRDLPIVIVTAYAARYSKESLIEAGANEVVTKPVDYTRLLLVSSRLILGRVLGTSVTRVAR